MTGEPTNEDEIRACGYIKRADGTWIKPPKGFQFSDKAKAAILLSRPIVSGAALATVIEPKRKKPKTLTKTEQEFLKRLEAGVYGKFTWIGTQAITLLLADDCRYTADFETRMEGGDFRFWEVKGAHVWEDSIIKLRVAARTFPFWTFIKAQKLEGQWTETVIPP